MLSCPLLYFSVDAVPADFGVEIKKLCKQIERSFNLAKSFARFQ